MAEASPVSPKLYFSLEEVLNKVPCRPDLSPEEIRKKIQSIAELIKSIGTTIGVHQRCINYAFVYMRKFCTLKCSCTLNSVSIAKAAICLAAKHVYTVESCPQLVKCVRFFVLHSGGLQEDGTIPDCKFLEKDLNNYSELLVETLNPNLAMELTDKFIKEREDRFHLFVRENCHRIIECTRCTTMYLEYKANEIGSFCVWLVYKWLGREVLVRENPTANHYRKMFTKMMNVLLTDVPEYAPDIKADIEKWPETNEEELMKLTAKIDDVSDTLEHDLLPSSTTQSK